MLKIRQGKVDYIFALNNLKSKILLPVSSIQYPVSQQRHNMKNDELKDQYSPRLPENWDNFKSWAEDQSFLPEEINAASSFQDAEKIIANLKYENESEKEYFENLHQLLQATEQLYINMCLIDNKMRTPTRKS